MGALLQVKVKLVLTGVDSPPSGDGKVKDTSEGKDRAHGEC